MEPRSLFPADRNGRVRLSRGGVESCFSRLSQRPLPRSPNPPDELILRGDHDLNPELRPLAPLTRAAVLVPLIERREGITVLLTLRTAHLAAHAGQISFPGGRIDPGDVDAAAAALREAEEEVGIPRERVAVLGRLDTYWTRTGFEIVPVVGFVDPGIVARPDPFEVAEIFEAPLDFLIDTANHQRRSREFQGKPRYFYAIVWESRTIWGATAGMLVNLAELLREAR